MFTTLYMLAFHSVPSQRITTCVCVFNDCFIVKFTADMKECAHANMSASPSVWMEGDKVTL